MVNQIYVPSEMNTGVLQTPVTGKGGKAKKSSRSAKSNKTGIQASGFNAGEWWPEMLCIFFLSTETTVSRPMINNYLCAQR